MSSRTRRSYDVISSLPDAIICHILSFLPTKQVVATSVLSKRWKHHWRSVPDIDLTDDQDVQQTDAIELDDRDSLSPFNEFVDSVLIKLDSIKSFRLKVGYNGSDLAYLGFPKVVDWLDQVVKRGVERILLTLFSGVGMKLPVSILNCKTLVELNLFSFNVKGFSSVRLPSLKILHLEECTFLNARDLVFLLAGCPILEDLHTFGIEFLSEDSLTYTECESLSLSKLTKAEMPFTYCHFPLKALHNVEKLHIEINQVYRSFDEIPTFHNLTTLKLHSIKYNWDLLVQVLMHCPNLQNVEVNQGPGQRMMEGVLENEVEPIFLPQCLSLQLKTCEILNFLGQKSELLLARYILKNARVLQTMKIHCGKDFKILRELLLCHRASPICEVITF